MESLVSYGSDSENSEIGTPNRHKPQLNPSPLAMSEAEADAARNAAQLQAEWESFAELIGDSALQGPMPVDINSIPLPDGIPAPPPPPGSYSDDPLQEENQPDHPAKADESSSDESDRSRSKSRSRSGSGSRSSSGSSGSSSDSESDDSSSGPAVRKKSKSKSVEAADCSDIMPENIPMPDAPSAVINERTRTESFTSVTSVTSEKSTASKRDVESSHDEGVVVSRKDRPRRRRDRSRSRDKRRRSRSRDRRRRRRPSRSKDRRRRRSRDRKRSRSPRRRRSRDKKYKRRSRSRSRDRKRRRRRSKSRSRSRGPSSQSRGRGRRSQSRSRDRRRRSRDRGGGKVQERSLTFKEQLKKSFIAAQREIEKTGSCSLDLGTVPDGGEYKPNEKPSNLPLYENPLLAVTGGADITKSMASSNSTPQLAFLQTMQAMHKKAQELTGVSVPKYYNPAAVNPLKYAEQVQKRKLLWSKKEPKEVSTVAPTATSTNSQWQTTVFSQDQDGKVSAKFRKLMGIKGDEGESSNADETVEEKKKKQQEMFQRLDQEYAMARMATHTHRGIGLGFSSALGSASSTNSGMGTGK